MDTNKKINNNRKKVYETISNNIKKFRKEQKLTANELSKKCNMSYGYLRNLESQKVDASISIENLSIIAEALNVDITDLLKQ